MAQVASTGYTWTLRGGLCNPSTEGLNTSDKFVIVNRIIESIRMKSGSNTREVKSIVPLLVDLDGSLIKTDTLYETALLYLKMHPLRFYMLIVWFFRGKHVLKGELSKKTNLNVDLLPYRQDVLEYLKNKHDSGIKIILCTGSWIDLASRIANKFPFIDEVYATDNDTNLTGLEKAEWAKERFGIHSYDYLGNERKDLLIWKSARKAIVVGSDKLASAAGKVTELEKHYSTDSVDYRVWLNEIRVHQWAKNSLLFVPLLTAHKLDEIGAVVSVVVAFFCFNFCASATYLLNDLLDLESDRKHAIKKYRPLAAGLMSIPYAVVSGMLLMLLGFALAVYFLNTYFMMALSLYLFLTIAYSFKFKQLQTIDVIVLASLFTIRVIAGGAAIETEISFWLLCFTMFLFLSLAMVKRVAELISVEKERGKITEVISGRGYFTADIIILQSLGGTSGFLSVFVFALYINSDDVVMYYEHPEILWIIIPVMGYWIMRIWMLTARDQMNHDPISFAITDWRSWLAALIILTAMLVATIY